MTISIIASIRVVRSEAGVVGVAYPARVAANRTDSIEAVDDSPCWMGDHLSALADRGFERINDPQKKKPPNWLEQSSGSILKRVDW